VSGGSGGSGVKQGEKEKSDLFSVLYCIVVILFVLSWCESLEC
jgi:hypothetical protein